MTKKKTKKTKSPKESTIVRAILDELRKHGSGIWFRKNHGGPFGSTGVPDIEVVFRPVRDIPRDDEDGSTTRTIEKNAIVVFLEVKRPGEVPTEIQNATMRALERAGAYVSVVRSKAEAISFLESLGLPPKTEKTL